MSNENDVKREGAEVKPDATDINIRPHGRLYEWLDNFWYHYKWVLIIGLFFVVALAVGIFQMVNKDEYDQSVVFAGPETLIPYQSAEISTALSELLPRDFNGDDKLLVKFQGYGVFNEKEMKEANEEETLENGQYNVVVTPSSNSSNMSRYKEYMMGGECAIYFVSISQYENLVSQERLCSVESICGETPTGMLGDGYGVLLGQTDLYAIRAMKYLPEDTVICFAKQPVVGACAKDKYYDAAKEFFIALVNYRHITT